MKRKQCRMIETSTLKFSIQKLNGLDCPTNHNKAWFIVVTLPDGTTRYLQWVRPLDVNPFFLGFSTGERYDEDDFFSRPGWYQTRSWARSVVWSAKSFKALRCEV